MSAPRAPSPADRSGLALTVLICTHDRRTLLARTVASLLAAHRPAGLTLELLVVANACHDDTVAWLDGEGGRAVAAAGVVLRHALEPVAGKSRALNRAIGLIRTPWVALVDDDHRIDGGYLEAVAAALTGPDPAELLCGRILPDWDGSEPAWVHASGAYRIYPLPVPCFDLGDTPHRVRPGEATPGGGNLVVASRLFRQVGDFRLDFGPQGHDLGGAEDIEWVRRALASGARLAYLPSMLQYHYVDPARLALGYLLRKAFQRSSSMMRLSDAGGDGIPRYLYRKIATYLWRVLVSRGSDERRFQLVRLAAALGEAHGARRTEARP